MRVSANISKIATFRLSINKRQSLRFQIQEFNYEGLYAIILGDIDGYYRLFNSLIVSEKDKYGYQNKNGAWF